MQSVTLFEIFTPFLHVSNKDRVLKDCGLTVKVSVLGIQNYTHKKMVDTY